MLLSCGDAPSLIGAAYPYAPHTACSQPADRPFRPLFLCVVPPSSLEHVPSGDIIKIRPGPFVDIFHALLSEQEAVLASVRVLLGPTSKGRLEDTEE